MTKYEKGNCWNVRQEEAIEKLDDKISKLETSLAVLDTKFEHVIANKHAEATSIAKGIETKFKIISAFIGIIGLVGMGLSLWIITSP